MKVLVAEDDNTSRIMLQKLLVKLGYEVEAVTNGEAALRALSKPDSARIAILDWMMPGMSGVEVCRKLRGTAGKRYVYLIILTARGTKEDVTEAFNAGSDDFLTKPANPRELIARFQVAARVINLQNELESRIQQLETLVRRHALLGQMAGKQPVSSGVSASSKPKAPPLPPTPTQPVSRKHTSHVSFSARIAELRALMELEKDVVASLRKMGFAGTEACEPPAEDRFADSDLVVWSPLILKEKAVWLDLKMLVDRTGAQAVYKALLGCDPDTEEDLNDALGEVLNMIQGGLKTALSEEGIDVITPVIPKVLPAGEFPRLAPGTICSRYGFSVAENVIGLSFLEQPVRRQKKRIDHLEIMELIAEPVRPHGSSGVPLLNKGVMLDARYIAKLSEYSDSEGGSMRVSVIEPSAITKALHPR